MKTYRNWLGHLRHVHSHDPNFFVMCEVDGCPSTFRKFTALYSHVYRKHRSMLELKKQLPSVEDTVEIPTDGFNLSLDGQSSFSDAGNGEFIAGMICV